MRVRARCRARIAVAIVVGGEVVMPKKASLPA